MKINIILIGLFLIALPGLVSAEDLSDYPNMFVDDNELDVIIVVGDASPATHAIAQAQIALSLTNFIGKRVTGFTKLASEVDEIDMNIISIGNACDNEITSNILGNPSPCDINLEKGKATIEFLESGDNFYIVLNALSSKGIKIISNVLSDYESYDLSGDLFEIELDEEVDVQTKETKQQDSLKDDESSKDEIEIKDESDDKIETKQITQNPEEGKTEPELILEEEDDLIKIFINWFLSLFKKND